MRRPRVHPHDIEIGGEYGNRQERRFVAEISVDGEFVSRTKKYGRPYRQKDQYTLLYEKVDPKSGSHEGRLRHMTVKAFAYWVSKRI